MGFEFQKVEDQPDKTRITTPNCLGCDEKSTVVVSTSAMTDWLNGASTAEAFGSELIQGGLDLLDTGCHPICLARIRTPEKSFVIPPEKRIEP